MTTQAMLIIFNDLMACSAPTRPWPPLPVSVTVVGIATITASLSSGALLHSLSWNAV